MDKDSADGSVSIVQNGEFFACCVNGSQNEFHVGTYKSLNTSSYPNLPGALIF
ncbi:MAG: hypothetical protein HYV28_00490 [Ignavibacteriales bacterium]|nr:hypothetical protein [Ignavibacteriales bacterium]